MERFEIIQGVLALLSVVSNNKRLAFLDLGCSGGGIVLDALLRGHLAYGLEGSDASLKAQRAEWRLLRNSLSTCDITKPFTIVHHETDKPVLFDVISAWEVLEHIPEENLSTMLENAGKSLKDTGFFVGSIVRGPSRDLDPNIDHHKTQQPYSWWIELFETKGFEVCTEIFPIEDLARGPSMNPAQCYKNPHQELPHEHFYIVAKKKIPGCS